eukprot:5670506-Pyramimonas_sp.AAC.1
MPGCRLLSTSSTLRPSDGNPIQPQAWHAPAQAKRTQYQPSAITFTLRTLLTAASAAFTDS